MQSLDRMNLSLKTIECAASSNKSFLLAVTAECNANEQCFNINRSFSQILRFHTQLKSLIAKHYSLERDTLIHPTAGRILIPHLPQTIEKYSDNHAKAVVDRYFRQLLLFPKDVLQYSIVAYFFNKTEQDVPEPSTTLSLPRASRRTSKSPQRSSMFVQRPDPSSPVQTQERSRIPQRTFSMRRKPSDTTSLFPADFEKEARRSPSPLRTKQTFEEFVAALATRFGVDVEDDVARDTVQEGSPNQYCIEERDQTLKKLGDKSSALTLVVDDLGSDFDFLGKRRESVDTVADTRTFGRNGVPKPLAVQRLAVKSSFERRESVDTVADEPTFNQKTTLAVPKPHPVQRLASKSSFGRRETVDTVRDSCFGLEKETSKMKLGNGMMHLNTFERRDSVDTVADTNPAFGRLAPGIKLNQSMNHLASFERRDSVDTVADTPLIQRKTPPTKLKSSLIYHSSMEKRESAATVLETNHLLGGGDTSSQTYDNMPPNTASSENVKPLVRKLSIKTSFEKVLPRTPVAQLPSSESYSSSARSTGSPVTIPPRQQSKFWKDPNSATLKRGNKPDSLQMSSPHLKTGSPLSQGTKGMVGLFEDNTTAYPLTGRSASRKALTPKTPGYLPHVVVGSPITFPDYLPSDDQQAMLLTPFEPNGSTLRAGPRPVTDTTAPRPVTDLAMLRSATLRRMARKEPLNTPVLEATDDAPTRTRDAFITARVIISDGSTLTIPLSRDIDLKTFTEKVSRKCYLLPNTDFRVMPNERKVCIRRVSYRTPDQDLVPFSGEKEWREFFDEYAYEDRITLFVTAYSSVGMQP